MNLGKVLSRPALSPNTDLGLGDRVWSPPLPGLLALGGLSLHLYGHVDAHCVLHYVYLVHSLLDLASQPYYQGTSFGHVSNEGCVFDYIVERCIQWSFSVLFVYTPTPEDRGL